jgi:hypothetical protein
MLLLVSSITVATVSHRAPANAVLNAPDAFDFSQLTQDQAKQRFKQGLESLGYLIQHFDEIAEGGGDNIRRYLGTVGVSSGLWGISKVMTTLKPLSDDIVEYTELQTEVEAAIRGADSSAYMSIFVTTSPSTIPQSKYLEDTLREAKQAKKCMDEMAEDLGL